jgi:hypothetical protein
VARTLSVNRNAGMLLGGGPVYVIVSTLIILSFE